MLAFIFLVKSPLTLPQAATAVKQIESFGNGQQIKEHIVTYTSPTYRTCPGRYPKKRLSKVMDKAFVITGQCNPAIITQQSWGDGPTLLR